jgi:hypothetical protein
MNVSKRKYLFFCLTLLVGLTACDSKSARTPEKIRFDKTVLETIEGKLAQLETPVTVHLYRGSGNESGADKTSALLDLMAKTSEFLTVEEHNLDQESDIRKSMKAGHGPIMILAGPRNSRSSYLGYPERKELAPFLDSILIASNQVPDLTPGTEAFLKSLDKEVAIRVFTTPD